MWGSRTNWPSYHGNILLYKSYIILKMVTKSIWNNAPNHPPPQKKQTWWFIEKTIPAYRVQRKQIIGPQDRCALPHCKLQAKILRPPAKQLDSCNRNIQIWGWIQLIQRRCGENQDQNFFLGVYVCSKNMKSSKHTLQEINISHPGKRKIIFKMNFSGDMLVPRRVYLGNL